MKRKRSPRYSERTYSTGRPDGVTGAAGQQQHRRRRVGTEEAGRLRRCEHRFDRLVGAGRDDAVAILEEGVQRGVDGQFVADFGEPGVIEVHGLDRHRLVIGVAQAFDSDDSRSGGDAELVGDFGLGIDHGDVDDVRAGSPALRRHRLRVRRQPHRLSHLRRGDERSSSLAADDAPLDGEIMERLPHRGARDPEALAQRSLRRHGRSWRHAIDLGAQPLTQRVVLRCGARRNDVEAPAVADDLGDRRLVAVEGQRLLLDPAVRCPAEAGVELPRRVVVGDHPQRRGCPSAVDEASHCLVE